MVEDKKYQLTRKAHEKLKGELENLEGPARQKIIQDIATARAHGDLSENAEYHAAREQQGLQESRVRQIREMLENAEIVEVEDDGTVKPGTIVTIKYSGDDELETYLIGIREEKGGDHEVLTPESPLGRALVGRTAGDTVSAQVPAGALEVEIVEIRTP